MADANVVAILTRAPWSGGKTRLFAALGRPFDPALPRALLLDTLEAIAPAGVGVVLSVSGGSYDVEGVGAIPQPDGDLGARMAGTMARLFDGGARRVLLIGSDLPTIAAAELRSAFDYLEQNPAAVVLGPATDGGYYLIGATRVPPLFDGIAWGTSEVLAQTLAAAAAAGLVVRLLAPLADVDTPRDLQQLPESACHTRAWLRERGVAPG